MRPERRRPLSDRLELGIAYELARGGTLPLDRTHGVAGRLAGSYNDTAMHFFAANLSWKF